MKIASYNTWKLWEISSQLTQIFKKEVKTEKEIKQWKLKKYYNTVRQKRRGTHWNQKCGNKMVV